MYPDFFDSAKLVAQYDPEVADAMDLELGRQRRNIELIASENFVSPAVMAAMGSVLTNKYAEGYPGKRYYGGCEYVDIVENLAIERAKELFGADCANVQPHSGAQANMAAYSALTKRLTLDLTLPYARCPQCNRLYDLSNKGIIIEGDRGSNLETYSIAYTPAQDAVVIQN